MKVIQFKIYEKHTSKNGYSNVKGCAWTIKERWHHPYHNPVQQWKTLARQHSKVPHLQYSWATTYNMTKTYDLKSRAQVPLTQTTTSLFTFPCFRASTREYLSRPPSTTIILTCVSSEDQIREKGTQDDKKQQYEL